MGLPLFYTESDAVDTASGTARLSEDDSHHLIRSLRATVGDPVVISDGNGNIYATVIVSDTPLVLSINDASLAMEETPLVRVIQGISRGPAMDESIRLAAESGAASIAAFRAPRSGSRCAAEERLERWRKIAREASMTARRPRPLQVGCVMSWPPRGWESCDSGPTLVLWEGERGRSLEGALPPEAPPEISVVVGPDGGFSEAEAYELVEEGGSTVTMGRINYRSASAGAYAVTVIRFKYGLMGAPGE